MRTWRGAARPRAESLGACFLCLWLFALFGAEQCQAFDGPRDLKRVETPKSVADAYDRAKLAWDQLQEPGLSREQIDRLQAESRACFRFVLAHPQNAKIDDLNATRYYLAYLDWMAGDYYDAAVLGEFLARRYTDRPEAQQGAEIALKAYAKLCLDAPAGEDRQFENGRMKAIADWIAQRWPKSFVADDARMMLVRAAIGRRNPSEAINYLSQIAEDSPRRGDAELMTGRALWDACVESMRLPESRRPAKAELSLMVSEGRNALESGIGRLRKAVEAGGEISPSLAAAVLTLAQIRLYEGQAEKAVAWLDDPKIGANTLAKAGHKATNFGNFRLKTFETALRAYAAAQQLDKAAETMNALEQIGGAANLAQIYLSLGRQFDESWKRLLAEGKQEEAAKTARGFGLLLTRIAARPASEINYRSLSWVADTLAALGDSLDSGGGPLSPEAAGDYKKAAQVYEKIIAACRADEKFAPRPDTVLGVQIKLARCLRRLGQFDEAMDVLAAILTTRENLTDAQREAAYTYQAWGEDTPGYFLLAIGGGHKVERQDGGVANLVWGWGAIARKVQSLDSYQDLFDEARYNLALCRLKYALSKTGDERVGQLRQAERDILVVLRIRPEMGGEKWYDRYDELLKKIQRLLGAKENEQGLKAAEQRMSAASK